MLQIHVYKIQVDKMALIWQLKLIQLLSDITYMLSEYIWNGFRESILFERDGEKHYLNNTSMIQSNKNLHNINFYDLISQAPKLRLIFHPYVTHLTQ